MASTDAIIALGLRAIGIAFRLAVALERMGRAIQDTNGIWAQALPVSNQQKLEQGLDRVNSTLSALHQAYIGQVLPGGVVVFGPPSSLDTLAQRLDLTSAMKSADQLCRCPMYGSHLPPINIEEIIGASAVFDLYHLQRPLYSAHHSSGPLPASPLAEVLRRVVFEIAHRPMHVEDTVRVIAAAVGASDKPKPVLTTIGSTGYASIVQDILQKHGQTVTLGQFPPCPTPFGSSRDSIPPDSIAVVGMSGRFPESDTLDEFWSLLETGKTTHQEIPASRFSLDDFYDPSRSKHNALFARHGCFIKNPGDFDHRLFNISPREALQMDPVQRMLLMITYEALELAGYSPASASEHKQSPPRIATYFGQTTDDWKTINEQQGIDTHFLPGVNRGFAPGRLSHFFRWAGGFYSIDTGCSSSATALCLARDALAAGECDAAVVGGGTLLTAPEWFAGLSQGGFLSPTGACKTFSDRADGYCRGEGVAVVVLKRLSDAIRSKDNVLAVIAGASRNCNAGAGSITYPGEEAQAALYRRVLRQAAVRPHEVNVIEMHGTGTQAGDRVEMHAVQSVFASQVGPRRAQPLITGAVKAAIGHSEAAAGIISLIKAILILQRNFIPPQPNQPFTPNPYLVPLLGNEIQLANGQALPRNGVSPRYIFVNNFDAAGGNVSMIIHDPPSFALPAQPGEDQRQYHVVVTSGRTATALEANKSRLHQYIVQHPDIRLADLAYTTTARRMHHVHRETYVVTSTAELLRQLKRPSAMANSKLAQPAPASSVVFAFTGQGSQYVGMGEKLFHNSPAIRTLLESYQALCRAQGLDCQFLEAIRGSSFPDSVPSERDMQVATVALEIALAQYWHSLGLRPTLLIGHSLGEYAALCIAGVLSVVDALVLAYERATLIFSKCPPAESCMLAIGLPVGTVQRRLRDSAATAGCEICCVNSPSSTVVGGPVTAIEAFEDYLKSGHSNDKVATTRLRVPHAFHTRYMDPVLDDLEAIAVRVSFRPPTVAVASTLLGRVVLPGEEGVFNAEYMRRHTREPVAFLDAVRAAEASGLIQDQSFAVEMGPHPTCISLMPACLERASMTVYPSLRRGRDDWETVSECLAGAYRVQLPVDWTAFHKDHLDNLRLLHDLPTYAFDIKGFWLSYQSRMSPEVPDVAVRDHSELPWTSVHSVVQIRKEERRVLGIFAVDLSNPQLAKAIGGHIVDGVAICPASIFTDMAYAVTSFIEREGDKSAAPSSSFTSYELADLRMQSPLVLRSSDHHVPHVVVEAVLDKTIDVVAIRFLTSKEESSVIEYGSCIIRLSQSDTLHMQSWSRMQPLVKARVQSLHNAARPKEVHVMDRRLFYKIFSDIVDYSADYHAVEEATVAADFHDACFTLSSTPTRQFGNFACNPVAIDAMVHVAGFLLNADVKKPKNDVHIANHIGSLRVLGDLSSTQPYMAYATIRHQDAKAGTSLCDVYLTDQEDQLVAICSDICFKKLDRDFFALLTGSNRAQQSKPRPVTGAKRDWQVPPNRATESMSSTGTSTPTSSLSTSQTSVSSTVNLAAELLEVVAARSGVSIAELKGLAGTDATFSEMGVDSQMSIAILADFQKVTGMELPAAFFTNFPTPAAVEKELGSSRPVADLSDHADEQTVPQERPKDWLQDSKSKTGPVLSQQLFALVTDALGLEACDLTPSTTFESIGMDSMLAIKITAAFQQQTAIELPAAFFTDHRTVAAAQAALDAPLEAQVPPPKEPPMSQSPVPSAANTHTTVSSSRQQKIDSAVSRAVLIQGQARSTDTPLFFTTDGSGTVESYIHLKPLPSGRRIYALESPFLDCPETFDLSIQEMATIFLRTIRRIQPRGPYLIGGWSAGSMYAYEVAHRLTMQGETISSLIILDMRAPSLIPTTIVTEDFVDKLGTFEGINRARDLPEDLTVKERTHLLATCRALSRYDAPIFPVDRQPQHIAVVWARLGLDNRDDAPIAAMGRPGEDIGKHLKEMNLQDFERYFNSWFYGKRLQFGTNGWEAFLGDHISVHTVDGG